MQFSGDYHMHTTYSDGRGSVWEMVAAAELCGLKEVGLADHGPANIGTGVAGGGDFLRIKEELAALKDCCGLRLYAGAEANITGPEGTLDLSNEVIAQLDLLLAGLHPYVWPRGFKGAGWLLKNQLSGTFPRLRRRVINCNTKALVGAIHSYDIWAITHPGLKMEIDIPEVARACVARNTAWEINTGHKHPSYQEVREAARCGVDFVVNSDAHFPETVGCLDYGAWVLMKAGVPCERVKNAVCRKE